MKKPSEQDVLNILATITRKPVVDITPVSKLRADLGMDSLAALELLVTLEEDHQVVVPQEQIAKLETVGDLFDYLKTI